jgi:hypothetical protein
MISHFSFALFAEKGRIPGRRESSPAGPDAHQEIRAGKRPPRKNFP